MKVNRIKKILVTWIVVIAACSVVGQFPPPHVATLYAIRGILILAGIYSSYQSLLLADAFYKNMSQFWLWLISTIFIENALAVFVPLFGFLHPFNIYFIWSVAIGFGYIYTSEKTKRKDLQMYGSLSILASIIFFFPPLEPLQPILFGIIQIGILIFLVLK